MTLSEPQVERRFGPRFALGLVAAVLVCLVDQADKWWTIHVLDIERRQPVPLTPFLDLVFVLNRGVSYGLFQQEGELGAWALFGFKVVAVLALGAWMARIGSRLGALALGLVIGGALGNMPDRFVYGGVADFFFFHVGTFRWYVFNLADVAIVAGVALLLYDSLLGRAGTGAA